MDNRPPRFRVEHCRCLFFQLMYSSPVNLTRNLHYLYIVSPKDFLGQTFCTLGEIIGSPGGRLERILSWVLLCLHLLHKWLHRCTCGGPSLPSDCCGSFHPKSSWSNLGLFSTTTRSHFLLHASWCEPCMYVETVYPPSTKVLKGVIWSKMDNCH